jgi:hypothetical protein
VIVALQGCVIVTLQGCVIVALQGCVIVALKVNFGKVLKSRRDGPKKSLLILNFPPYFFPFGVIRSLH